MRPTGKRRSLPAIGRDGVGPMSMAYLALRRSSFMGIFLEVWEKGMFEKGRSPGPEDGRAAREALLRPDLARLVVLRHGAHARRDHDPRLLARGEDVDVR